MHITDSYASKLAMAGELAVLGARAVTITAVARVKPGDARAKYRQVNKTQSRSGQTPSDHQWFLATPVRRQHGALLLLLYAAYRARFDQNPDAHGLAFIIAYRQYLSVCYDTPSPPVSTERFNLLVGAGFSVGWRDIIKGRSSNFASDNVKVLKCRVCNVPHLVEEHLRSFTCQEHEVKGP